MRVSISNEVLRLAFRDKHVANHIKLVFCYIHNGRHELVIRDCDDETLYQDPEFRSFREDIEKAVTKSVYGTANEDNLVTIVTEETLHNTPGTIAGREPATRVRVHKNGVTTRSRKNTRWYISPSLVEEILSRPVSVVLENIESDRIFLETCLDWYAGLNLDDLVKCHLVELVHCGGCGDMPKVVKARGRKRVICICDSDIYLDGSMEPKRWKKLLELYRICRDEGYQFHILRKREIENYIPDQALLRYIGGAHKGHPYFSQSDYFKDRFDMKKGSAGKNGRDASSTAAAFQAAAASAGGTGYTGFGDKVRNAFRNVGSLKEMESRDWEGELPNLVGKIIALM